MATYVRWRFWCLIVHNANFSTCLLMYTCDETDDENGPAKQAKIPKCIVLKDVLLDSTNDCVMSSQQERSMLESRPQIGC